MKAKLAYWQYEAGYWARGLWVRYWPPARIKAVTAERDDWIRWCESAEERLTYHRDLNKLAQGLIASQLQDWSDAYEPPGWGTAATMWLDDYRKTLT